MLLASGLGVPEPAETLPLYKNTQEAEGVSQCRGRFLGRTSPSESGPSEAMQESFLASENEELWNRLTGVQVCVICEALP